MAGCAVNGLRRQPGAPRQRGRGCCYGRAVVRRVCGHVARRLAYQRGQVCQERLAIEFPAVPAALPAPESVMLQTTPADPAALARRPDTVGPLAVGNP